MRIFRDVDMVEALGSGMPRIMSVYKRDNFKWTEHFMRLVLPFYKSLVKNDESLVKQNETLIKPVQNFNELEQKLSIKNGKKVAQKVVARRMKILETIIANPFVTMEKLAQMLDISVVAVNNNINELKRMDFIRHSGPVRGGCWDIFNDDVKQFVKHYFEGNK